jgi:hypothetical protein
MAPPHPRAIVVDVGLLASDAATLDALARLELAARRAGRHVSLRNASSELRELLSFAGLDAVLRLEPQRQAEERKEPLGVEEERELADPSL